MSNFLIKHLQKPVSCLLLAVCSGWSLLLNMSYSEQPCKTQRILQVAGDGDKKNDVIFCGSHRMAEANVIFFSGDVQDYKEKMLAHRDNKRYARWDLESTASILSRRFPHGHIWVMKAAHMELGTFNIFSNFVRWKPVTDGSGGPMHDVGQRSWHHLQQLLVNAVNEMNSYNLDSQQSYANDVEPSVFRANIPVILVGFSKGCVVLNQLAYDLSDPLLLSSAENASIAEFINLVTGIYWLDGGHAGGRETWVTREDVLRSLTKFEVFSHVTPYQISDPARPWIGREQRRFVSGIAKCGGKVKNTVHFETEERSLENHFKILELF